MYISSFEPHLYCKYQIKLCRFRSGRAIQHIKPEARLQMPKNWLAALIIALASGEWYADYRKETTYETSEYDWVACFLIRNMTKESGKLYLLQF